MRVIVVGASTLLGKEMTEELSTSTAATAWDLRLLDEAEEGPVQLSAAGDEAVIIQPLTREAFEDADLVFFAGEGATAREYWRAAANAGAAIIDLTGALEDEPGFLVRSPWVGGGAKPDLTTAGIVTAHPAALMLAMTADRLSRHAGLSALSATVLEPASQAGKLAMDELHQQTVSLLSFQSVPREIYDTQVAFSLQAELGENARVALDGVRATIRRHLRLLLGSAFPAALRLDVVQAPVFHGYTISALADLTRPVQERDLRETLGGGIILADPDTAPSNVAAAETGEIMMSFRPESSAPSGSAFWLWMAADNLRLAARNGVAAALELIALRPATRVQ